MTPNSFRTPVASAPVGNYYRISMRVMAMSIMMELPVLTSSQLLSPVSFAPLSSKRVFYRYIFRRGLNLTSRSNLKSPLPVWASWDKKGESLNGNFNYKADSESELTEVICIGSRRDAVTDFCLDSPFQSSSSLRFWNIHSKDSSNVQLQERFLEKDLNSRFLETSEFLQLCPKAVILVASAAYGFDHVAAIDILKTVRSNNGFAVAIFLKPFSFEGQRRQDEVKDLAAKLQEHINFCIDIDTDMLLKKDMVTLDEALKTANSAVLMAINAVSVLVSEMHWKLMDVLHDNAKELKVSEAIKILEGYKEAKIGFGAGNNIRSSILSALYDCPFIGAALEDLNGIVICIVSSSGIVDSKDVRATLHNFRQTMEYKGEIIISTVHEPNLEPSVLVTTVVTLGCTERQASQKISILSRLALHFPFVFKLFGRDGEQLNNDQGNKVPEDASLTKVINSEFGEMQNRITVEGMGEGIERHPEEFETSSSSEYNNIYSSRSEETEIGILEDMTDSYDEKFTEGTLAFQREPLISWNVGPGHQIAQEWAKERAGTISILDNLSIFHLPVGVRSTVDLKGSLNISYALEFPMKKADDTKERKVVNSSTSSWTGLREAGFLAVKDFCNSASTVLKGRNGDVAKQQGVLSVRAAFMLEAERDSPKKWNPIMEMQYRGGIYRGRCQGGLPEGKGRLVLGDGSIYDGMWRFGKRSGPGAFYFSNGDVFQGSWRDDVMHGKGWFYFHTGDRWFANFWKGKANGESRFYSKSGDVFFGHFQDGWRHGQFLCIDVDGARCLETWEEGVLVNCKQLDDTV